MLSRMTSTPAPPVSASDPLVELLVAVVDRHVGAELAAGLDLARRPGGGEHAGAALVGQLDRHRADAAACRRAPATARRAAAGRSVGPNTIDQTVQVTSGSAAASTSETLAGTGISWPAGTATRSA